MKNEELLSIIDGCRNNDRLSQKKLYDQFYGYALSIALPYCSQEAEAREVLNDAFLKVFSSIDRYDADYTFNTWLRTIVVRTAINYYHKHLKANVLLGITEEGLDYSVEDEFISKMAVEEVLRLVQKLPPAYRLTMNLFALEGHSHPEIAELLGITVGASKSNLSKARNKLKILMTNELIPGK